eukprot:COSAG06_NODE_20984_length_774_cov_1.445926_1_plen_159_part_00
MCELLRQVAHVLLIHRVVPLQLESLRDVINSRIEIIQLRVHQPPLRACTSWSGSRHTRANTTRETSGSRAEICLRLGRNMLRSPGEALPRAQLCRHPLCRSLRPRWRCEESRPRSRNQRAPALPGPSGSAERRVALCRHTVAAAEAAGAAVAAAEAAA